jgi:hypothetical protein
MKPFKGTVVACGQWANPAAQKAKSGKSLAKGTSVASGQWANATAKAKAKAATTTQKIRRTPPVVQFEPSNSVRACSGGLPSLGKRNR